MYVLDLSTGRRLWIFTKVRETSVYRFQLKSGPGQSGIVTDKRPDDDLS